MRVTGLKEVLTAQRNSFKLSQIERQLSHAVEQIAFIVTDNEDLFPAKRRLSVIIRTETLLRGMEDMIRDANDLADPVFIEELREDLAEYRRTLESEID